MESIIEDSLAREKRWQEQNAALREQIKEWEKKSQLQEKQNQSNKMILRLRERALEKLRMLQDALPAEAQELLFSEIERQQKEKDILREQLENNPLIVEKNLKVMELKQRIRELEVDGSQTNEDKYNLSQKFIEATKKSEHLQSLVASPQKLLNAMETPARRKFESFELEKWKHEQDYEKKLKDINEELVGAQQEAIAFKGLIDDAERERDQTAAKLKEAHNVLSEQKAFIEAMKLRHEQELVRLAEKQQAQEDAIHAIYAEEMKVLDNGLKKSSEETQASSMEAAATKAKLISVESELSSWKNKFSERDAEAVSMAKKIERQTQDYEQLQESSSANLEAAGKSIESLTARLKEAQELIADEQAKVANFEEELKTASEALEALKINLADAEKECQDAKQVASATRDEIDRLEQVEAANKIEIDRLHFDMEILQEDHESLLENFGFQETHFTELKSIHDETKKQLQEMAETVTRRDARVVELEDTITALKEEIVSVAEKGSADVSELVQSKRELEELIAEQQQQIAGLTQNLEKEGKALEVAQASVEEAKAAERGIQSVLDDVRGAFADLQTKLKAKDEAFARVSGDLQDSQSLVAKQEDEISIQITRLTALEAEVAELQDQQQELEMEKKVAVEELTGELKAVTQKLNDSQDDIKSLGAELERTEESLTEAKLALEKAENAKADLVAEHGHEIQRMEATSVSLKQQHAGAIKDLKDKIASLQADYEQQTATAGVLGTALEEAKENHAKLRQQNEFLSKRVSMVDSILEELKNDNSSDNVASAFTSFKSKYVEVCESQTDDSHKVCAQKCCTTDAISLRPSFYIPTHLLTVLWSQIASS